MPISANPNYFCSRHGSGRPRQSIRPNCGHRCCHWWNHQRAHIYASTNRSTAFPKCICTAPCSIAAKFAAECLAGMCGSCGTTSMSASNFSGRQHTSGTHGAGTRLAANTVRPIDSRTPCMITIAANTAPNDTNRNSWAHHFRIGTADGMRTHTNWLHSFGNVLQAVIDTKWGNWAAQTRQQNEITRIGRAAIEIN